jgi:hypothetical protein
MEFAIHGFNLYSTEVDDHGIDMVAQTNKGIYYAVQIKSVRNLNYVFFLKDRFALSKNLLAALVLFFEGEAPQLYLIPSLAWSTPNSLLVSRDYKGKKSKPEWGICLSPANLPLLLSFQFDKTVNEL